MRRQLRRTILRQIPAGCGLSVRRYIRIGYDCWSVHRGEWTVPGLGHRFGVHQLWLPRGASVRRDTVSIRWQGNAVLDSSPGLRYRRRPTAYSDEADQRSTSCDKWSQRGNNSNLATNDGSIYCGLRRCTHDVQCCLGIFGANHFDVDGRQYNHR